MGALVPVAQSRGLLCLADACRALAEAKQIEEVIDLRDRAQAVQHYMRQRGESALAMLDAAELKLRAERRLGELLAEMPKHPGGRPTENQSHDVTGLSGLGIGRMDSSRWQKLASIDDEKWEEHIALKRQEGELTTAGALRLAKELQQPGKRDDPVVENGCTVDDLHALAASGKRFGCIYADPPWRYDNQATRASTDNHYQTMAVEEIAALPIKELAAESSHLHLWTTNAFLFDCPRIMEAWGFDYKGMYVWCKPQIGIGNYWRVSHEILLLGTRKNCPFQEHDAPSWGQFDRGRHSAKPEQIRHIIERVSPGPRLELFGRLAVDGWTVWGNEIERDLFHAS